MMLEIKLCTREETRKCFLFPISFFFGPGFPSSFKHGQTKSIPPNL